MGFSSTLHFVLTRAHTHTHTHTHIFFAIVAGTHTTRYDDANKCVRHSFRPFAFALMRDETMADLEACVEALEETTEFLWGKKLKFYAGGGDKAGVGGCLLGSL